MGRRLAYIQPCPVARNQRNTNATGTTKRAIQNNKRQGVPSVAIAGHPVAMKPKRMPPSLDQVRFQSSPAERYSVDEAMRFYSQVSG